MPTDQPQDPLVEVVQADREAAANYMAFVSVLRGGYDPVSMAFMDAICDDMPIVQTLARHRIAVLAAPRPIIEAEALERAADVADAERDKANKYVMAKLGGAAGIDRNLARYSISRSIATAILKLIP